MRATFRVLISNLEGTLLDGETPARLEALHALRELHEREIPVVLCTSRTFEQTVVIREQLGIAGPFIVENGGAIYFPRGYFALTDVQSERKGDYQRISLGLPYGQTTLYLALLKKLVPGPIKGFSDMSLEEIAREGGLSPEGSRAGPPKGVRRAFQDRQGHEGRTGAARANRQRLGLERQLRAPVLSFGLWERPGSCRGPPAEAVPGLLRSRHPCWGWEPSQ